MSLKKSNYKQNFGKKSCITPTIIVAPDALKLKGSHLEMNSVQRRDFSEKKGDKVHKFLP